MESRGAADGERKTITALFADLKGSTALIDGLDPEDARAIIDPALQLMMDAVHRMGFGIGAVYYSKRTPVSTEPSTSLNSRKPNPGNCARPRAWPGCGRGRGREPKPVTCWLRSMTGSPKGLIRRI